MRKSKMILIGGLVAAAGAVPAAAASPHGRADGEVPITGPALEQASKAALAATNGGRITGTEVGDEESYYEVEVTTDRGIQIDVQLDRTFNVVSSQRDEETDDTGSRNY